LQPPPNLNKFTAAALNGGDVANWICRRFSNASLQTLYHEAYLCVWCPIAGCYLLQPEILHDRYKFCTSHAEMVR
jgi:hypothetical protein